MLEALHLKGAPAFDASVGTTVGPLKSVNFLFGPNGSGKTTISRGLAKPDRFPGSSLTWHTPADSLGVKVYNSDYVTDTLKQAAYLPGVFLLGKTNAEIQTEIEGLTGPRGTIANAKKQLKHVCDSLDAKKAEIKVVRDDLKEAAWGKRSAVPSELQEMFRGVSNSKESLLTRLLEVAAAHLEAPEDFDALKAEASAVLADDAIPVAELPLGQHIRLEGIPGFDLLNIPIVGSEDVGIAPLIEQLRNADWVQHGRHYLDQAADSCPFCQQRLPEDLAAQLDAYFDKRYTQQLEQLKSFKQQVQAWANDWHNYLEDLLRNSTIVEHLDIERFRAARLQLEQMIEHLISAVATKLGAPSTMVNIESPMTAVDTVNAIIAEVNTAIRTFNVRLQNRSTAKKELLNRCWVVFARQTLATEVGHFEGAMPALSKGRESLEAKVGAITIDLQTKETRLRELQAKITSSKPIIDTINRLLDSVGFHSFRLKGSTTVKDGYSLVRQDGQIAADSLSEGEQTFITFLYFAQSLQGAPQDNEEPDDLLAVIDDPISSLDSDVLYAVSTLVRRIVADIAAGSGRVRQLVVMTHNAHFHKEVTYKAQGDKHAGWQYGIVRKRNGQPSEIVLTNDNPIHTAYGALWDEVRRTSSDPTASGVGLQNILRRIIETYFKVLGGVDNSAIIAKFDGDDQGICRSMFSWLNAGSHSIFDDLDYAPTPTTVESNLRVFRQIFKEHGQEGHYLMMMGESAATTAMTEEPNESS